MLFFADRSFFHFIAFLYIFEAHIHVLKEVHEQNSAKLESKIAIIMSVSSFNAGNLAFTRDEFEDAISCYSKSLSEGKNNEVDCYINRAHAYQKIGELEKAREDIHTALEKQPDNSHALYRKGLICMSLKQYQDAADAFESCELNNEKCGTKLNCKALWETCRENGAIKKSAATRTTQVQNVEPVHPPEVREKYKHDWYQTESAVIVTVLIKNVTRDCVNIEFTEKSVDLNVKLSKDNNYVLHLDLAHEILPSGSTFKAVPSKIEISLKKREGIRWSKLEGETDDIAPPTSSQQGGGEGAVSYPSSHKKKVDWDKLEKQVKEEEEKEETDGEAGVQKLFQKIYGEGSDEVRKAMNKSFMESGGTCLSTNWGEVGTNKVDIKPPDGMEWKQWS